MQSHGGPHPFDPTGSRSACERSQGPRKHVNSAPIHSGDAYSSGRWLTPPRHGMNSMATRRNARHEERIVIGAAHHLLVALARRLGRLFQRGQNRSIACRGRIGIDQFRRDGDAAPARHFVALRPAGPSSTRSRRAPSVSRMSVSSRTREGMLLTAPGNTSHTPTVATVSIAPVDLAAVSSARINSAAAARASLRPGISLRAGMAAFALDHECACWRARRYASPGPRSIPSCSSSGPCSMCSSTN